MSKQRTCVTCGALAEAAIGLDWYCHAGESSPTHYETAVYAFTGRPFHPLLRSLPS